MSEVDMKQIDKRRRVVDAFIHGVDGMTTRGVLEVFDEIARELGIPNGIHTLPSHIGMWTIAVKRRRARTPDGRFAKLPQRKRA